MASKFGKAWAKYNKAAKKLGAVEKFPNPDKSEDKSFITTGVYQLWGGFDETVEGLRMSGTDRKTIARLLGGTSL